MEDQDYNKMVEQLKQNTANALRNSGYDPDAIKHAIQSYLQEGYSAGLTGSELIDFFCVDTPSIVDSCGFNEASVDQAVSLFDTIHDEFRHKA